MTSYRSQVVPPIPPFKGGPLQATDAQNRRTTPAEAYAALAKKTAQASAARSTGPENVRNAHNTSQKPSERRQATTRPEGSERPRPPSRLEREKKRNYNDPKSIGAWKLEKLIGQGASGRVRLAVHSVTGQQAAVKIIPRTLINQSRMSLRDADAKANKMILGIEREIVIMKLIEHPNLLGLWDVYETSKELYLIMEYVAGGELFDHLVAQGKLSPRDARGYFRQIIFGMDYCHRFNICHRDLKPENLLLDATKKIVKVADFGMAALQPTEKMLETSCGSPHYASPEIVSGKRYKGTASDIWSCGIILFALLCGRLPFDDPNIQQLLGKVRAGKFIMPEWLEPSAKDLIWRMLEVDPEKRITMAEIMRHAWFSNNGLESDSNPVTTSMESFQVEELQPDSIDIDILGNLKTLWFELSEEDIVKQLLSPGQNWQKSFYTLLVAHRENHSADDEEEGEEEKAPAPVQNNSLLTASHALSQSREKARPRRSLDASGSAPPSPRPEEQQKRTSAVSTASASHRIAPPSPTPPVTLSRPGSAMGHRPSTADGSRQAAAAKLSQSPEKLATAFAPSETTVPKIKLQGSSPQKTLAADAALQRRATSPTQRPGSQPGRAALLADSSNQNTPVRARNSRPPTSDATPKPGPRASSRPVSPTKPNGPQLRPTSIHAATNSPNPNIHVPQVGDATMQKFFQGIADELASIRTTGDTQEIIQSKLDRLRDSVASASIRSQTSASATPSSRSPAAPFPSDMNQFEDAEDDVSEVESMRSASESAGQPYTPTTPLTPLSPMLNTVPLSVGDKANNATPNARSIRSTRGVPSSVGTNSRPASLFSNGSGTSSVLSRRRSMLGSRKDKENEQVQLDGRNTIAYEQTRAGAAPSTHSSESPALSSHGGFASPQMKPPTRLQKKNPGLGLDIVTSNAYGNSDSVSPSMASSTPSTPATPSMTASPKNSWFAGLFNWKPATFTLMSTENFSQTLADCSRKLQSYGIRVVIEDSEHHGVLKCSVHELREANGVATLTKPVRFRVEFTILPVGSAANSPHLGLGLALPSPVASSPRNGLASPVFSTFSRGASSGVSSANYNVRNSIGFATSVTMIQEKGALSTFKLVYTRLRRDWRLDQPISAVV